MATQEKNLSYHLSKMLHGNADESANLDKENNRQGLKMVASDDTDNVSFLTIDSLAKVNGDIETTGDVIVDGIFNGQIRARNIKVTKKGQIVGTVIVKVAEVSGSVEPSIYASEKVVIYETGRVKGKISSNQLVMHLGAKFVGDVEEFVADENKIKAHLFK